MWMTPSHRGLIDREPDRAEYRLGIAEALLRSRDTAALTEIEAGLAGQSGPKRTRAMLLQAQGRALVASASKHLDPSDCAGSAGAVRSGSMQRRLRREPQALSCRTWSRWIASSARGGGGLRKIGKNFRSGKDFLP